MIIIISFATLILFIFLHICFFLRVCSIVIRAIYLIVVNIKTLVKKISYNILSPLCFFLLFENQIIRYIIYYMCVCVCVCFVICLFILLCIYIYMKVLAIYRCLLVKIDAFMCFVFVEAFHQTKKVKQSKANFHFL